MVLTSKHNLIMLAKALSWQRRLFPYFNHYQTLILSPFCSEAQSKWSQSAQKAVFASAIIEQILNGKYPQSFTDQSLREKIINLRIKNQNFTMDQEYRNQVLQMFTTGVHLSPTVFKQPKVMQGRQIKPETKMVFCPNYLVTKQIFQQFTRKHTVQGETNLLITGSYGIAKTISIILFIQISNYVQKFIYEAKSFKSMQAELQKLRNLSLIKRYIPKVVYWSIDMDNLQTDLCKLILEQFPQLSKQQRFELQQKKIYQKFIQYFQKIYPQTVYRILVIDHVNSLTTQIREWNTYLQLHRRKMKDLSSKQAQRLEKQAQEEWEKVVRNRIKLAQSNMDSLKRFTNRLFLNSSENIELKILQRSYQIGKAKRIGLSLHHSHKKIQIEILEYQELLKNHLWARIDFWNCFWFQFTRKFLQETQLFPRLQSIKTKIKQRFLQNTKEGISFKFQIKPFYRFLFIRQYFDKSTIFQSISNSQSDEQLLQTIETLLKEFEAECIVLSGNHAHKIAEKYNTKQRLLFFRDFYSQAKQQFEKGQKDTFSKYIDFQKLLDLKKYLGLQLLSREKAQLIHCESLTLYQIKQRLGKVSFTISPLSFMQISAYILFPKLTEYFPTRILLDVMNASLMGYALQSYLIECIQQKTEVQFTFAAYSQPKGLRFEQWKKQKKVFKFDQNPLDFIPLKKNPQNSTKKYSFSNSFVDLFQKCKNSPNEFFAALPSTQKTDRLNRDYQSASIDFAFAVFQKSEKIQQKQQKHKYKLYTFDMELIGRRALTNVSKKQNDSYDLLVSNKEEGDDVQVMHTIIAAEIPKSIRTQIYKSGNWLTVTYASWKEISFINVEDSISKDKFNKAKSELEREARNSPSQGRVEN